jgi:hypothetical protein
VTLSSLWWWLRLNASFRWVARIPGAAEWLSIKRLVNNASIRPVLFAVQRLLPRAPISASQASKAVVYGDVARLHARVRRAAHLQRALSRLRRRVRIRRAEADCRGRRDYRSAALHPAPAETRGNGRRGVGAERRALLGTRGSRRAGAPSMPHFLSRVQRQAAAC